MDMAYFNKFGYEREERTREKFGGRDGVVLARWYRQQNTEWLRNKNKLLIALETGHPRSKGQQMVSGESSLSEL